MIVRLGPSAGTHKQAGLSGLAPHMHGPHSGAAHGDKMSLYKAIACSLTQPKLNAKQTNKDSMQFKAKQAKSIQFKASQCSLQQHFTTF